jgi:hypothetical protein
MRIGSARVSTDDQTLDLHQSMWAHSQLIWSWSGPLFSLNVVGKSRYRARAFMFSGRYI